MTTEKHTAVDEVAFLSCPFCGKKAKQTRFRFVKCSNNECWLSDAGGVTLSSWNARHESAKQQPTTDTQPNMFPGAGRFVEMPDSVFKVVDEMRKAQPQPAAEVDREGAVTLLNKLATAKIGSSLPQPDNMEEELAEALERVMAELWWCAIQHKLNWKDSEWRKNSSIGRAYDNAQAILTRYRENP